MNGRPDRPATRTRVAVIVGSGSSARATSIRCSFFEHNADIAHDAEIESTSCTNINYSRRSSVNIYLVK
jgi:hypothetical protein